MDISPYIVLGKSVLDPFRPTSWKYNCMEISDMNAVAICDDFIP